MTSRGVIQSLACLIVVFISHRKSSVTQFALQLKYPLFVQISHRKSLVTQFASKLKHPLFVKISDRKSLVTSVSTSVKASTFCSRKVLMSSGFTKKRNQYLFIVFNLTVCMYFNLIQRQMHHGVWCQLLHI